ncbi:MAG: NAD(P)/FAD-dependent oxidoreductase [Ferruginibacter sp.]
MTQNKIYDAIIIGGSYAGLSAAMSLGRSLRQVLIIDSGKPCNSKSPHSHNFITHDGQAPGEILKIAKDQVLAYPTIEFHNGLVAGAVRTSDGFELKLASGESLSCKKIIFATGLKDIMPDINGYADCWGISILHCPYCHGYEMKNEYTGLIGNGNFGFELTKMIRHWSKELVLFTNGKSMLTNEQAHKLKQHRIKIIETAITGIGHQDGMVQHIILQDGIKVQVKAIYARPLFVQHSDLPKELGCEITAEGLIKVDQFQKTTVAGVFACGDNATFGRAVSMSVSTGSFAGIVCNKELIEEAF